MFEAFIFGASGYFIVAYIIHVGFGFMLKYNSEEEPSRHDESEESIYDENARARSLGYDDRSDEVSSRS